ncbi:MAG: tetratricopeptide repeat protein [Pirellulaceae bacterium]|nr:tetratricopeptide repeat protein [Pirellulaceae bacterium]
MSDAVFKQLEIGVRFQEAGELQKAEQVYQNILAEVPNQPDVMHLLGLIEYQSGQNEQAIVRIGQAVRLSPNNAVMLSNFGEVLRGSRRFAEAIDVLKRAIAVNPKAHNAYHNLGITLLDLEQNEQAILAFRQAIEIQPQALESRWQLIAQLIRIHRLDEALLHTRFLVQAVPDNYQLFQTLGVILNQLNQLPEAEAALRRAIAIEPKLAIVHNDIGSICQKTARIDEAIEAWQRCIEIDPKFDWPYNNIAAALKDTGRIDESIEYFKLALQLNPEMHVVRSNMLLTLHYSTSMTPEAIFEEHRIWQAVHQPTSRTPSHDTPIVRRTDRRLRIGYVSADFRSHSVADFLESILSHHDKQQFEIFCYSDVKERDIVTERLAKFADVWRNIVTLDHDQVCELIRSDQIEILVDLAGHSANNRMPVFAKKPAPIQVSWLGYPDTTGLDTIDYRITDSFADPEGWTERFHSERLWRLPECFLCYHPTAGVPEVGPLPSDCVREITFASFNNFAKLNQMTIQWWASILKQVPNSRLLLKATVLSAEYARKAMRSHFQAVGLDEQRVEMIGSEADFFKHIQHYHRVDIGLDTFPYHGTTTTCEALWMGVPVVTLAGKTHASRVGVSLLNNVGLDAWIANDPDEYIRLAVDLASDRNRLRGLRSTLRWRMAASPLLDQAGFTRKMEAAFCAMFTSQSQLSANS